MEPPPGTAGTPRRASCMKLRRKAEAADEVLEARIRMQRIESIVGLDEWHLAFALTIRFLQPRHRVVSVTQPGVNSREFKRRNVVLFRDFRKLAEYFARFVLLPRARIYIAERRKRRRISGTRVRSPSCTHRLPAATNLGFRTPRRVTNAREQSWDPSPACAGPVGLRLRPGPHGDIA